MSFCPRCGVNTSYLISGDCINLNCPWSETMSEPDKPAEQTATAILGERKNTHGDFGTCTARTHLDILHVFREHPNFVHLSEAQRVSLEMIGHKIARILCGDPNFDDHWDDIMGYAKLGRDNKRRF